MKNRSLFMVAICLASLVCLVSCSDSSTANTNGTIATGIASSESESAGTSIDTPVRVGTNITSCALLYRTYSFNEAYGEATLVADITIDSWLREVTGDTCITVFSATVNAGRV